MRVYLGFTALIMLCCCNLLNGQSTLLLREVASREYVVYVNGLQEPLVNDLESRAYMLHVDTVPRQTAEDFASVISKEVSLLRGTNAIPAPVNELVINTSPTGETVDLSWSGYNEIGQRDVVRYDIYVTTVPFDSVNGMTPTTSVSAGQLNSTISGLPEYVDHYFAVVAVDALGGFNEAVTYAASYVLSPELTSREYVVFSTARDSVQPISREVSFVSGTDASPALVTTLDVTVNSTGDQASLTWTGYNEQLQRDLLRYDIYFESQPFTDVSGLTPYLSVSAGAQSINLDNLPSLVDHYFAVVAVDVLGNFDTSVNYAAAYVLTPQVISREYVVFNQIGRPEIVADLVSREVSMLRPTPGIPAPITGTPNFLSVATSTTAFKAVSMDWSGYNETAQIDVLRYRIYVGLSFFDNVMGMEPFANVPAGTQTHTLSGLESRGVYYFAVVAEDYLGNSNPVVRSISAQASVGGVTEVRDLTAISRADSLEFQWLAPEDSGDFLDGYHVYFAGAIDPIRLPSNATSWEATGLEAGRGYPFRITTLDIFDNESGGDSVLAATLMPNPVITLQDDLDGVVELTWAPAEPESLVKHYAIYVETSPITDVASLTPYATTTNTFIRITGLNNDQPYYFAVATVNISDGTEFTTVPTFTGTPVEDTTGPAITSATPTAPTVSFNSIQVSFSEAIRESALPLDAFTLIGPLGSIEIIGITTTNRQDYTISIPDQIYDGTYTFTASADIVDLNGLAMDQDADGILGESVDDVFAQIISLSNAGELPGNGTGLVATYFDSAILEGSSYRRLDATVDFDWGNQAPFSPLPVDAFSVRWEGQVRAQFSDTFTFYTQSDDGVRLWVDGVLIIDDWNAQPVQENSGTFVLNKGQSYEIVLEYFENTSNAEVRLLWSSTQIQKQIIPASQLISTEPFDNFAATPTISPDAGSYASSVVISLSSSTLNAEIFYTFETSEPFDGWLRYENPFVITSSSTLRAIATRADLNPSGILEAPYTIDESGPVLTNLTYSGNPLLANATIGQPGVFRIDASDPSGVSRVDFTIIDPNAQSIFLGSDSSGSNGYTMPWAAELTELDGAYTLRIAAVDALNSVTVLDTPFDLVLAPPLSPVITVPENGLVTSASFIEVGGTAPVNTDVVLYVNGVAVNGSIPTNNAGNFTGSVSVSEGINLITALAQHRGGDSALSPAVEVEVDRSIPGAPLDPEIFTFSGGLIQIRWRSPDSANILGYNVYRSTAPFNAFNEATLIATEVADTVWDDVPGIDGVYYYRLQTVNRSGIVSEPSELVSGLADATGPIATSIQLTHRQPSQQAGTRLAPGLVDVVLTVDEAVSGVPFLSLKPATGSAINVVLESFSTTEYRGTLSIESNVADGNAAFGFSARDLAGNGGAQILSGATWYLDSVGPVIESLSIVSPEVPILNQPVPDSAELTVDIVFSEVPQGIPSFGFTLSESYPDVQPLNLVQGAVANEWSVVFTLPGDAGLFENDLLSFAYDAVDSFGNTHQTITVENAFLVYQGTLPGLGATASFFAESLADGVIRLNWLVVDEASGYRIYRTGVNDNVFEELVTLSDASTTSYLDTTSEDGTYQYYLVALRTANAQTSEGDQSPIVSAVADSHPPQPPINLQLTLNPAGVSAVWQDSPDALFETLEYRVYRGSNTPITDVAGQRLIGDRLTVLGITDPNPSVNEPNYVVTAVDSAGNESVPSNSEFLNVGLLPVQNLTLNYTLDEFPVLSWDAAEIAVQSYDVGLVTSGGTELLQSSSGTNFIDPGFTVAPRTYNVVVQDTFGESSLVREILLPNMSLTRIDDSTFTRGLMNRLVYSVTNLGTTDLSNVRVQVLAAGRTHQSASFDVPAGNSTSIEVVVGGYREVTNPALLTETIIWNPEPGKTVNQTQTNTYAVSEGGLVASVFGANFRRATDAEVSFSLFNPSDELIEIVLAEANGANPSPDVRFNLMVDGQIISTEPAQQAFGQNLIALADGSIVLRLPAQSEYISESFILPIPENAPTNAQVQLLIDRVFYRKGQAEQIELQGTEALSPVVISNVAYTAEVTSVSPQVVQGRQPITISGQATTTDLATPAGEVPITVVVQNQGFERTYWLTTEVDGSFTMDFTPNEGEGGSYQVWARHRDVNDRKVEGAFTVETVEVLVDQFNVRMPRGVPIRLPFAVRPSEGASITGMQFQLLAEDQPIGGVIPLGMSLTPEESVDLETPAQLAFLLQANDSAARTGLLRIRLTSTDAPGVAWDFIDINYTLTEGRPLILASESNLLAGINPGDSTTLEFSIRNDGVVAAQDISLSLFETFGSSRIPPPSWAQLGVADTLQSLAVGESSNVSILIYPPADTDLATYNLGLQVSASNSSDVFIPIDVSVNTSETGTLVVKCLDIYSFTEPDPDYAGPIGSPEFDPDHPTPNFSGVRDVRITLQNEQVTSETYVVTTDGFGEALFADIPVGRYRYRCTSDNHYELTGRVRVESGTTVTETAQLENALVVVQWEVAPITIEDRYEILLTATFETEVPVANIVATPAAINLPKMCPGDVFVGEITYVNYGLIRADNFVAGLPESDQYFYYEFLENVPDTLEAGELVIVPFRVTCLDSIEGNCEEVTVVDNNDDSGGSGGILLASSQTLERPGRDLSGSSGGSVATTSANSSGPSRPCSYTRCYPYDWVSNCINGLVYTHRRYVCYSASGSGGGCGGRVVRGGSWGAPGRGWVPRGSAIAPPNCECSSDPCCDQKGVASAGP